MPIFKEAQTVKVYNPYNDEFIFPTAYADVSRESNGKFIGIEVVEVITEEGADLMPYLSKKAIDEIEVDYLREFEG